MLGGNPVMTTWFQNFAIELFSRITNLRLNRYVMSWAIWYRLHNLKNLKNVHGGVLLLLKLACNFTTKSNTPPWVFSRFWNCEKGSKSRNASHISMQHVRYLCSLQMSIVIAVLLLQSQSTIDVLIRISCDFASCGKWLATKWYINI